MSRYHLSYDVKDSTEESYDAGELRKSLLKMLWSSLKARNVKCPVASTIVFDTECDDRTVSMAVAMWRKTANVYYYLSRVSENYDNAGSGYILANDDMMANVKEEYESIKSGLK